MRYDTIVIGAGAAGAGLAVAGPHMWGYVATANSHQPTPISTSPDCSPEVRGSPARF